MIAQAKPIIKAFLVSLVLGFTASSAFAGTVEVNGTCVAGNCTSPTTLAYQHGRFIATTPR
jgi:hypothetical protein